MDVLLNSREVAGIRSVLRYDMALIHDIVDIPSCKDIQQTGLAASTISTRLRTIGSACALYLSLILLLLVLLLAFPESGICRLGGIRPSGWTYRSTSLRWTVLVPPQSGILSLYYV